jgi:hypothetical protein
MLPEPSDDRPEVEPRSPESAAPEQKKSTGFSYIIDEIKAGAVAVGEGAQATINKTFNVNVELLPLVIFLIVLLVVVVIGAAYLIFREDIPQVMLEEFNVAVAEFAVVDENGDEVNKEDGRELGEWLYDRLEDEFIELGIQNYELWPPEYTGAIPGSSSTERETNAAEKAEDINADVLVYGVLSEDEQDQEVNLEFYVRSEAFAEGEEISGEHRLGNPIFIDLPFDKDNFQGVDNPPLIDRTSALSLLTIGLSYYVNDNYGRAIELFEEAESLPGWFDRAGKEVVYLLLGNAYVRMASNEKNTVHLQPAGENYTRALAINPDYARARVGQASLLYMQAIGDPSNPEFDDVNPELLAASVEAYQEALTMADAPNSANIDSKVHYGLGQNYLVRIITEGTQWLGPAKDEFGAVIADFEKGNVSLEELAGHAHAQLGLIAWLEGNVPQAIAEYEQATGMVSPFYRAQYRADIGDVYASDCQISQAREAYDLAIRRAESIGDEASANKYAGRRNALADQNCE